MVLGGALRNAILRCTATLRPSLNPEPKLIPTACSTSQIVPGYHRKLHGVQHQREEARCNIQRQGAVDGAVMCPSGFHKRGYENVSQAASTMFQEDHHQDRGSDIVVY